MEMPHVGPAPKFEDGTFILIRGTVLDDCDRFHINLACGPGKNGKVDTPLHLNPRFEGTNAVVRNSFLDGKWGQEERDGPTFPLNKGQDFECTIKATVKHFKISFNGQPYCEFAHRKPMEMISHLVIEGPVKISKIKFHEPSKPISKPGVPKPSGSGMEPVNLSVESYMGPLPQLKDGIIVHIVGTVNEDCERIFVNLICGSGDGDIAMHINPRFDQKSVVRNSQLEGSWGEEERDIPEFPLSPGEKFVCSIAVTNDKYEISFNGKPSFEFVHRTPMERVSLLGIGGGMTLNDIRYEAKPLKLNMPLQYPIPGGLHPGRVIRLSAVPNSGQPNKFTINLTHLGDLAFHFDVRFKDKAVVCNSCLGGNWGKEQRTSDPFPFTPGINYDLVINCDAQALKVSVNNNALLAFGHRVQDLKTINNLEVYGEVRLTSLHIQ